MTRTSSYIKTIEILPNDPFGDVMDRLKAERQLIRFYRAMAKGYFEKGLRIKFRGRLGKNNPHRHLYAKGGSLHKYFSQDIRPEHATRFDVYVFGGTDG